MDTSLSNILNAGDLAKGGAEALVTAAPGRRIVSIARAQMKAERLLQEGIERLRADAKREGWSSDWLGFRINGLMESLGRTANLDAAVKYAQSALGDSAPLDDERLASIDSEWLNYYIDHTEKSTSDDMRKVWGAVLAGEINRPGSCSKRSMSILADMDRTDAMTFRRLCSFIVAPSDSQISEGPFAQYAAPTVVLLSDESHSSFNQGAFTVKDVMDMEALGLFSGSKTLTHTVPPHEEACFSFGSAQAKLVNNGSVERGAPFRGVLTAAGMELCTLCTDRDEDAIDRALGIIASDHGLRYTRIIANNSEQASYN